MNIFDELSSMQKDIEEFVSKRTQDTEERIKEASMLGLMSYFEDAFNEAEFFEKLREQIKNSDQDEKENASKIITRMFRIFLELGLVEVWLRKEETNEDDLGYLGKIAKHVDDYLEITCISFNGCVEEVIIFSQE